MIWNPDEVPAYAIIDYYQVSEHGSRYDYHHPLVPQLQVQVEQCYNMWVWSVWYMDTEITSGEYFGLLPALSYGFSFVNRYAQYILPKRI